jgi:hypothetical protein
MMRQFCAHYKQFSLGLYQSEDANFSLKHQININNIQIFSPYFTGNTLRIHNKAQPVIDVWENNRCLL